MRRMKKERKNELKGEKERRRRQKEKQMRTLKNSLNCCLLSFLSGEKAIVNFYAR